MRLEQIQSTTNCRHGNLEAQTVLPLAHPLANPMNTVKEFFLRGLDKKQEAISLRNLFS